MSKAEDYMNIRKQSSMAGDWNACSVIALALVANTSYKDAYLILEQVGRKFRVGAYMSEIRAAIAEIGLKYKETFPRKSNGGKYTGITIGRKYSIGTYMVVYKGHVAAMVDGTIHDHTNGCRNRVISILRITPKASTQPIEFVDFD